MCIPTSDIRMNINDAQLYDSVRPLPKPARLFRPLARSLFRLARWGAFAIIVATFYSYNWRFKHLFSKFSGSLANARSPIFWPSFSFQQRVRTTCCTKISGSFADARWPYVSLLYIKITDLKTDFRNFPARALTRARQYLSFVLYLNNRF
jgi:hypothetical protein